MPEPLHLRSARPDDAGALSDLAFRSKAYWGYMPAFMEACRAELTVSEEDLAAPAFHAVLAERDGAIVGFYALSRCGSVDVELEALFVEPAHIGRGVGRALMNHATATARAMGARTMTIQGDPHATAFYRAAGGVQVGEQESDSISGRMLPVFRIALDAPR